MTALHAVILDPAPTVIPRACPICGEPRLFADCRWLYEGTDYRDGDWPSQCPRGHVWIHPKSETFGDED